MVTSLTSKPEDGGCLIEPMVGSSFSFADASEAEVVSGANAIISSCVAGNHPGQGGLANHLGELAQLL